MPACVWHSQLHGRQRPTRASGSRRRGAGHEDFESFLERWTCTTTPRAAASYPAHHHHHVPVPPPPPAPTPTCSFEVSPPAVSIRQEGERAEVRVSTDRACAWSAASQAPWITLNRTSGTGSDDVRLDVAANPQAASRTDTVLVAGRTVTVTQAGTDGQRVDFEGQLSGLSGTCPALRFVVNGNAVRTDAATDFHRSSCNELRNGDTVRVRGVREGGEVRATRVERD